MHQRQLYICRIQKILNLRKVYYQNNAYEKKIFYQYYYINYILQFRFVCNCIQKSMLLKWFIKIIIDHQFTLKHQASYI